MKTCRFCFLLAIPFLVNSTISFPAINSVNYAFAADEAWKAEFDQICGQTDNATNMSTEELVKSLERCDRLKPRIEQLEATPRKIYLKRLQMCRNLFAYMIETRKKDQK